MSQSAVRSALSVIVGCANQAGKDNQNIARMPSLLGGLPVEVPAREDCELELEPRPERRGGDGLDRPASAGTAVLADSIVLTEGFCSPADPALLTVPLLPRSVYPVLCSSPLPHPSPPHRPHRLKATVSLTLCLSVSPGTSRPPLSLVVTSPSPARHVPLFSLPAASSSLLRLCLEGPGLEWREKEEERNKDRCSLKGVSR
jgi:hypothetical protein